jgi:predicted nuclease of predicted toxin-antitoxin system
MVRFLADASLNHYIVTACRRREPAIDFLSALEADLEGISDPEVLALAAAADRILVTHDVHTMPQHFGDFLLSGGHSPGVFLVSQRIPVAEVAEALVLIWGASNPSEWQDLILEIPF